MLTGLTQVYIAPLNKEQSYLAGFYWEEGRIKYKDLYFENLIFNDSVGMLSWALNGYIYKAVEGGLESVKFTQRLMQKDYSPFSNAKFIPFQAWKGRIINAGDSSFGVLIECEYALVIMNNENDYINIQGPIARWRVFSEQEKYKKLLHVILEDKISIYSF